MTTTVDMSDLVTDIQDEAARIRDTAGPIVLELARADAPVSEDNPGRYTAPGRLRDSLRIIDTVDEPNVYTVSIGSDLPYAQFTDDVDTAPHLIFPVRTTHLRFWWDRGPTGAHLYFLPFVRHPGTTGQHWFEDKNEERWDDALAQAAG